MNLWDFFTEFGSSLLWPLTVILILLVVLREAWEELRPIFVSMVNGFAKSAVPRDIGAYKYLYPATAASGTIQISGRTTIL